MFLLNDTPLALDTPFEANGVLYPANALRLLSLEEKQAIGIVEVADPESWDQQFYWSPELPKDHAQLVEQWTAQTRTTCGTLIAPTDWMVVREADNGTAVPAEVKAKRQDYRNRCEAKLAAIAATTTTEELQAYIRGPEYPTWQDQEPERARNERGQFVADDPATPAVNEAWTNGGQG